MKNGKRFDTGHDNYIWKMVYDPHLGQVGVTNEKFDSPDKHKRQLEKEL